MTTSYSLLYQSLIQAYKKAHLNKSTWVLMASALACAPAVAAENELASQQNIPVADFPKMTVTATRTPTAVNNTIAQTHVIDSQQLNTYKGQSAFDVINRQPGFANFSYGGMGASGNFYLRGYDSKSILVLIDGVRYSSLSAGGAALSLLPAEHIDRIEVLYGASGSSMYGADAMGGVIQIFTKGQNVEQNQFSITAGAGNNDHYLYSASAQMRNDNGTSLSLSASRNETKGHSAVLPDGYGYNKDDDGFESENYSLNLKQKVNNELTLGVSGLYSESTTDIDSADEYNRDTYELISPALDNSYTDQKNGAGTVYAQYNTDQYDAKLSYGYSIDKSSTYETEAHIGNPSEYDTKQQQIDFTGSYKLPVGKAIYGAAYLKQELDSNVYEADDRKVKSSFLGYLVSHNNIDAQANVRYDDYSDFDSETTYNFGVGYHFTPEIRAGINYAKGYRVPTFNDLYGPNDWGSNPNLKSETSDNYESFLEYSTSLQSSRLTGYYNKVDDYIVWQSYPTPKNPDNGKIENINKAKIKGFTLNSDWNINNYLFGLSYDYQKATDHSDYTGRYTWDYNINAPKPMDYNGNYLVIRPKHKGMVYVGYQLADLNLRAEYQYVDNYYYNAANTTKVDDYNLVNISGNYQLTPALSMSARLNNVFNKKYITSPGYSTDDGTNFLTSLTYTWK